MRFVGQAQGVRNLLSPMHAMSLFPVRKRWRLCSIWPSRIGLWPAPPRMRDHHAATVCSSSRFLESMLPGACSVVLPSTWWTWLGVSDLTLGPGERDRLRETQAINSSLSTLGLVIMALSNKESHVPY